MKKAILIGIFIALSFAIAAYIQFQHNLRSHRPPRNVILMIADGAGFNHFRTQAYYAEGTELPAVLEAMPVKLAVSTYPEGSEYDPQKAWADSVWIRDRYTDSAAAATAMSTGVKTSKGVLGMTSAKEPLRNVTSVAKEAGKGAGVVTTVMFAHATPAGFVAHQPSRNMFREIAREMIASDVDVIIGCGYPTTGKCKYVGDDEVWKSLQRGDVEFDYNADGTVDFTAGDCDSDGKPDAWKLISTPEEFAAIDPSDRVLGIPMCYHTLQQERPGDAMAAPYQVAMQDSLPDLSLLSTAALTALSDDPDGFFLMIEGGAVDWAAHDNQVGRMIEEQTEFIHAVETVVSWIESHGGWDENLLIVTADHETGYLSSNESLDDMKLGLPVKPSAKGVVPNVIWRSGSHTNSLVPLFSAGKGSELLTQTIDGTDPVFGDYIDNTDIGQLLIELSR